MSLTEKKIYELLPAIYRIRDIEQGEPLKALFGVIAREAGVVENDIDQLYENWFIETCDEWMIPYIGDLLGVRGLHSIDSVPDFSMRAYVANTLRYRRRKGTASVLEQLALDTTGWRARVVEFFDLLGTTQNINHIRLHNIVTPDLRCMNKLELLNTAFDTIPHTVDVRSIEKENGWYNISNIGIFLWRLQCYRMSKSTARKVNPGPNERFTFSPLGNDIHLFNRLQTEKDITHLAEEHNVPGLLRRLPLYQELEDLRQGIVDYNSAEALIRQSIYFGTKPVLQVILDGSEIPPAEILICNLQDWRQPPDQKPYQNEEGIITNLPISVAVDPVLGRITFPTSTTPEKVQVYFNYGFSGDVGGGPYDRQESVDQWYNPDERPVTWQIGVTKDPIIHAEAQQPELLVETLQEAIAEWNIHINNNPGTFGVIAIMDSDTYEENLTNLNKIEIPKGSKLAIVAADWPQVDVPDMPGVKERKPGYFLPTGLSPHIIGNISVKGTALASELNPGDLVLDGLLTEGKLTVLTGNLGNMQLSNCTLVPSKGRLTVNTKNSQLKISVEYSISGKIKLNSPVRELMVNNSIIDAGDGEAIFAANTATSLKMSTVLGSVEVNILEAENSIFTGNCHAERTQTGCVRFSFTPDGSQTPRRYRCQPELALTERAEELGLDTVADLPLDEKIRIINSVQPAFTSVLYGHHGYCQLSYYCPLEIKNGAEDFTEMGVFNYLKQPQRETNLQIAMDEYLNLGLKAGLIYVT